MRRLLLISILILASTARAQEDPLARARAMAASGQRAQALRLLETRLLLNPRDNDARTLYGIMLSWDGQLDRARHELQAVLIDDPRNNDAREALARIELWSRPSKANPQQSQLTFGFNYDHYERSDAWREGFLEFKAATRRGALIGRASHARRFGRHDDQFEIEAYPIIGRRSYAYLSIGYAPDPELYPQSRLGGEFYQGFARGLEASLGVRRLDFDDSGATNVYTGSLSKYVGNWLVGGRIYESEADTAVQFMARRYLGDRGGYVGLRVGRGSTRDDIRSAADLQALETREVVGEGLFVLRQRWIVNVRGGIGRGSQQDRYSLAAALGLRF